MGYKLNAVAAVLVVTVLYFVQQRQSRNSARQKRGCAVLVQHQPAEPFFGLDFIMKIHQDIPSLHRFHQRHGHSFQLNTLISLPTIYTVSPENIRVIHTDDDKWGIEPGRLPGMEYFCGRGFLTMDGDVWRHARRALRPSFAKSNLLDLSILSREVDKVVADLPKDGGTVDLQPLFYVTFLNTSLNFLLGISPDDTPSDAPCTPGEFVDAFHDALFLTMIRMMLGRVWRLLPQGRFLRVCNTAHAFLNHYIDQALGRAAGSGPDPAQAKKRSLVQDLSQQSDDQGFIRSQILQGMMASQETTSSLLGNALFLLSRHPSYWGQVRSEVLAKDDISDFDTLLSSKVLQNIILETLRLYPVFPLMGRIALCDTVLPAGGGPDLNAPIFVPKGAKVEVGQYSLHRDPRVFGDDTEAFRPERWDSINPTQWEFMAFGGGSRACLGRQKSLVEAAYVLARLAREFPRLDSRDAEEWKGDMKLTCKSANGCKVALYKAST